MSFSVELVVELAGRDAACTFVWNTAAQRGAEAETQHIFPPGVKSLGGIGIFRVLQNVLEDAAKIGVAGHHYGLLIVDGRRVFVTAELFAIGIIIALLAAFHIGCSADAFLKSDQAVYQFEDRAWNRDPGNAAATLVEAQAQAMQDAAKNEGGMGAMGGFFGMNMAQNAGAGAAANLFAMGQQQPQAQQQAAPSGWVCACGQGGNTGKFCMNCGKPQPSADGWTCSCGTVNKGKFCQNCGSPKPAGAPLYKCDKCGWEPEDPANPPKFCPECGDIFDDNDKK